MQFVWFAIGISVAIIQYLRKGNVDLTISISCAAIEVGIFATLIRAIYAQIIMFLFFFLIGVLSTRFGIRCR